MTTEKLFLFWGMVAAIFIGLLWVLSDVIAPFLTGLAIAYFLDPVVSSLGRRIPRGIAALLVLLAFAFVMTAVIVILSPMIGRQAVALFNDMPGYVAMFQDWSMPYVEQALGILGPDEIQKIRDAAQGHVGEILRGGRDIVARVLSGGMAVIDVIMFFVITPIVAFYGMRDWQNLSGRIDTLFPRRSADSLRAMFREFDVRLAGFVRGQLLVCLFLGTFYAVALTSVGLKFGLAIGFIAGILSFIPYVGSVFGFVTSVGVAFAQFSGFHMPAVVVGIFFLGQFIEGNFLTPKLVGERIGVHPVWVIFALMAGGKLFGFTGMLLAVPVTALLGVVLRYAIDGYKKSPAYLA